MILGIFLSPGDSLEKQSLTGQESRFIKYYLAYYAKIFSKVYVFSYGDSNRKVKLPNGVILVVNSNKIPYFLYQLLIPIIHKDIIKTCHVFRVMQTTGGLPALIIKILYGKKYMVTYGYNYSRFALLESKKIRSKLLIPIIKLIIKNADAVIVTNKEGLRELEYIKNSNKIFFIPNGVSTEEYKPVLKPHSYNINILSVGRLTRQKNHILLLKAVKESKYRNKLRITIIGRGELGKYLHTYAAKNKLTIKIISQVKHDHLPEYFAKSDIFCLPSLDEGSPKVLIEAMSSGKVIIASDIASNRELITDKFNGLLFKFNPKDLATKIDYLLVNREKAVQLAIRARSIAEKKYDIDNLIKKEKRILKCLV